MGPPPPPPPPPPQLSSTILPSRSWKTENASRRDNNTVPAPPKPSRPSVDSQALQHAAARLRKTGYNQQIRGDEPNLSNERLDGQNERMSNGDRQNRTQFQQLDINSSREQVHVAPSDRYIADQNNFIRRQSNSLNPSQVTAPLNRNFDSTPKNLYQTFNNPTSDSFIDRQLIVTSSGPSRSDDIASRPYVKQQNPSSHVSSYSTTTSSSSSYNDTQPVNNLYSSSSASNSNYSSIDKSIPIQPQKTSAFATTYTPSIKTNNINNNNNNNYVNNTREYSMEWTAPYEPGAPIAPPIKDPRARIHDFATTTMVEDNSIQNVGGYNKDRRTSSSNNKTSSYAHDLRDRTLTPSQRYANQFQKGQRRLDNLPFDASQLIQQSYNGDEVDSLVLKMQKDLHLGGKGPATTTTTRNNICVACRSEVTNDKPGCTALDQIFHVACFRCKRCDKGLAGASFYNIDNTPICEACYQDSLDKCTSCGKSISDKLLRACGGTFHVACFVCTHCKCQLDGIPFTVDADNAVHCVPCFHDKFAPKCAVCGNGIVPVEGEKESVRVVAMEKSFHVDCYRCEDCGLQLSSKIEGQGCYPLDSHLYCKTCNSNRQRVGTA